MGDITDLYSTVSKVRVSPQKAFNASYALTNSYADVTGITLNVENGQYYAAIFAVNNDSVSQTLSIKLMINGVAVQTITANNGAQNIDFYLMTNIFQNTSGSTQVVKIQAQTGGASGHVNNITLLSGTLITAINGLGKQSVPLNAYINNLEFIGGTTVNNLYGVLNGINTNSSTSTILISALNIFVNSLEFFTIIYDDSANSTLKEVIGLIAFDFDGKTLAL